jgi:hypothetical protein
VEDLRQQLAENPQAAVTFATTEHCCPVGWPVTSSYSRVPSGCGTPGCSSAAGRPPAHLRLGVVRVQPQAEVAVRHPAGITTSPVRIGAQSLIFLREARSGLKMGLVAR